MLSSNHIRNSNLIEDIDDPAEDVQSMEAWAYLIHQKKLTLESVLETHRLITLNQLAASESGHLRTVTVYVGQWVAPKPFLAEQMLHNWLLDMADYKDWNPKAMHIRFERIHPFIDGNGRTGRMLMWWHESMLGREPTIIKYADRYSYYRWFETKKLKPIPEFKSDQEEADFWDTHDSTDYIDWAQAERVNFPNLKRTKRHPLLEDQDSM